MALLGWLYSVEGATLDWIGNPALSRDTVRELLVKMLGGAMRAVEELDPTYQGPAAGPPGRPERGAGRPNPRPTRRHRLVDRLDQLSVRGVTAEFQKKVPPRPCWFL